MKKTTVKKNVFPKSKVPIKYLLDYVKEGLSMSDFIASYPWLKKKDIKEAIEEIKKRDFTSRYAI